MTGEQLYNQYRVHYAFKMGVKQVLTWNELSPAYRETWNSFAGSIRTQMISVVKKAMEEA